MSDDNNEFRAFADLNIVVSVCNGVQSTLERSPFNLGFYVIRRWVVGEGDERKSVWYAETTKMDTAGEAAKYIRDRPADRRYLRIAAHVNKVKGDAQVPSPVLGVISRRADGRGTPFPVQVQLTSGEARMVAFPTDDE